MTSNLKVFVFVLIFSGVSALAGYQIHGVYSKHNAQKRHAKYQADRADYLGRIEPAGANIVFLGDSLIERGKWSEHFPGAINRGIGYDTTKGVLNRLDTVTRLRPGKVFLMVGVNDVRDGIPLEESLENFEAIIARLDTKIIVFSVPDVKRWSSKKREKIKQINEYLQNRPDITFVPITIDHRTDGVHFNAEGYFQWVDVIKPLI